ncbi:MAG: LEA type 2 family protein [Gammaproteobacteria bacterium]|nr:LEA type 2 family protein [Gammaproteobacteria bacterium]
MIRKYAKQWSWILLAVLLLGCATVGPRLEAPALSIANVEIIKGDLFEQRFRARMKVQNPNDRELRVRGITYTIELGGEDLGRGLSGGSFVVPARGEAEFDMLVTANFAGTLLKLAERARKEGSRPNELGYRMRGEVKLDSGLLRTVPFDQKGTLPLR